MLLMPWGRVGSNVLFAMLKQSATIKLNNESLNQLRTVEEQAAWFAEFYEIGAPSISSTHIGSKQNVLAVRNFDAFSLLLQANGLRIVRLRRDNIVKCAVSQMRAEQYADQTGRETGVRRWAVRAGNQRLGATRLDPEILVKRIGKIESLQRRLMEAFPGHQVLDIEYEEINRSLDRVVEGFRDFLDMPQVSFKIPFLKATPDALAEAIENFAEIRERLSLTPWMAQLES
jgi:LPS sulfotransferase NodH